MPSCRLAAVEHAKQGDDLVEVQSARDLPDHRQLAGSGQVLDVFRGYSSIVDNDPERFRAGLRRVIDDRSGNLYAGSGGLKRDIIDMTGCQLGKCGHVVDDASFAISGRDGIST